MSPYKVGQVGQLDPASGIAFIREARLVELKGDNAVSVPHEPELECVQVTNQLEL